MSKERTYPKLVISAKGEDFLNCKNNWVYENEVLEISDICNDGDIVDVFSKKDKYLGSGFISNKSKIRVRIFSRNINDTYDQDFFKRRLTYAIDYRMSILDNIDCCRVVFGEADGLPGLTIDKYNDILVSQIATCGIEKRKQMIFDSLLEVFKDKNIIINAIYERNDLKSRTLDGLEEYKGYYYTDSDFDNNTFETIIIENGIKYYVDFVNGQKTGFFLDQKFNRALAGSIAKNKKVLDCFTHTASFGLNCANNGAKEVTCVDISPSACAQSERNIVLNNFQDKIKVVRADVFDYLDNLPRRSYDFIILDPPAFTKSRSTIMSAFNGYKHINKQAMKLLGRGGYLATCSCSHFMSEEMFLKMLLEAADECGYDIRQISYSQQSKDHPIMLGSNQTDYLKFYLLQII